MKQYDSTNLMIHPGRSDDPAVIVEVRPEEAGWDTLWFQVRRLAAGGQWQSETGGQELALVVLSGVLDVSSNRGDWHGAGRRPDVFAGLPYALYLPPYTTFCVGAVTPCEWAIASAAAGSSFPPHLVTPDQVGVEIRGGGHATRQINNIMPPGFPSERLVVVEVYTPGGNWSSYPPHKHDRHREDAAGALVEADLDEIYYYRFDRPGGYALQRVYTGPDSPLQLAGRPIDATVTARDHDVVLIPEGYHPVSSPVGYTTYYLNVLAGSAQSLAATDDPQYAWVKGSYASPDPRVPVYNLTEARKL
ncbi:MAG: 5-deoxy-glucuronate isomerase [Acidobacteriota bacterium]